MVAFEGPQGVELLPHESLRLTHLLTDAELHRVNYALAAHGVATFGEPVLVAEVVARIRWLGGPWRAHVMSELEAALLRVAEGEGTE